MSRGRPILELAFAGFAALALIGALPGCERSIGDEDFEEVGGGETPVPTAPIQSPNPTPCVDPEDAGGCL